MKTKSKVVLISRNRIQFFHVFKNNKNDENYSSTSGETRETLTMQVIIREIFPTIARFLSHVLEPITSDPINFHAKTSQSATIQACETAS